MSISDARLEIGGLEIAGLEIAGLGALRLDDLNDLSVSASAGLADRQPGGNR
jgi:hypothetical protein